MLISFKKLSNPEETAVSLKEALKHLRLIVTDADGDAFATDNAAEAVLINALIGVAERYCEGYCRRQLVVSDWAGYMDYFPRDGELLIQKSPVIEVSEVAYFDAAGEERILGADAYEVDVMSEPARIRFKNIPQVADKLNAVCIKFSAGYADDEGTFDASLVPKCIKQAMLLIVGHLYEHREQVVIGVPQTQIDFGVDSLLGMERVFLF